MLYLHEMSLHSFIHQILSEAKTLVSNNDINTQHTHAHLWYSGINNNNNPSELRHVLDSA